MIISNGTEGLGGIVGEIGKGSDEVIRTEITNCYNTGRVEGTTKNSIGGILGFIAQTKTSGTISNNYNLGVITGEGEVGTIIGHLAEASKETFTIEKNYALAGLAPTEENVEIKTEEEMKREDILQLLGTDNWKIDTNQNNGYPILMWQ